MTFCAKQPDPNLKFPQVQLTLDPFQPGTISKWWSKIGCMYGGCLVGMFLDLVSVGHISMSHAKICPGTPPLLNISFRRGRPTRESRIPRTSRMPGRHGMMPWYWPRGGMKRPRESGIIEPGASSSGIVTMWRSCHYPITSRVSPLMPGWQMCDYLICCSSQDCHCFIIIIMPGIYAYEITLCLLWLQTSNIELGIDHIEKIFLCELVVWRDVGLPQSVFCWFN